MILVLGGTLESRKIIDFLIKNNFEIAASTFGSYGKSLIKRNILINDEPFTQESIIDFINKNNIDTIIDASHPYAVNITKLAINTCEQLNIKYIRFERANTTNKYNDLNILHANSYEDAAKLALKFKGIVFSTLGSRCLEQLCSVIPSENLVVRVLPQSSILKKCHELNIPLKNIIGMQGPFSVEMNIAMFKNYNANVILTKDSGNIGGVNEKLEAANKLGLDIIMIDRPKVNYPCIVNDINSLVNMLNMF